MASRSELLSDFFQQLQVIFAIRTRYDELILIKAIFSFDWLYLFELLGLCSLLCLSVGFGVNVIDESPFLKKVMNPNNSTGVSRQTLSGFRRRDVLVFAQLNDIVSILLVKLLMLLKLDIALSER